MIDSKGCYVDGRYFETINSAWEYLQEINGRIPLDMLIRFLKKGRRIIKGNVIGYSKELKDGKK